MLRMFKLAMPAFSIMIALSMALSVCGNVALTQALAKPGKVGSPESISTFC
jgi:hypothetical protein